MSGLATLAWMSKDEYRHPSEQNIGPRQYGIVFEPGPSGRELRWPAAPSGQVNGIGDDAHGDKSLMFPFDVEVMEGKENCIRSLPRFELFDSVSVGLGKPLYLFDSNVKELRPAPANGEVRIFWTRSAIALGQGDGEDIKRRGYQARCGCC